MVMMNLQPMENKVEENLVLSPWVSSTILASDTADTGTLLMSFGSSYSVFNTRAPCFNLILNKVSTSLLSSLERTKAYIRIRYFSVVTGNRHLICNAFPQRSEQFLVNSVFGELSPTPSPVLSMNRQEDRVDENAEVIEPIS